MSRCVCISMQISNAAKLVFIMMSCRSEQSISPCTLMLQSVSTSTLRVEGRLSCQQKFCFDLAAQAWVASAVSPQTIIIKQYNR